MINSELSEKIKDILIKKAEGYDYTEETYEYQKMPQADKQISFDDILDNSSASNVSKKYTRKSSISKKSLNQDEELTLLKKKVTTHHIPPDMLAIKILLENFGDNNDQDTDSLLKLSDDELISLKDNLLESLKNIEKEEEDES